MHSDIFHSLYRYALVWFANLPRQATMSWANLVEAFIARFHDYAVQVTPSQVRPALTPCPNLIP